MEHEPKTEPGLGSTDHKNLDDMSIHELVSVLRTAYLTEDFDRVEGVLVSRYKRLQTEILRLQEMVELEKLTRFQAEEDLRNREELCERGKKAQNNYEKLLKEVKKNPNLADRHIIVELRKKKNELELEVSELRKLKKKWVDDSNALAQLRIRVDVLENKKNGLEDKDEGSVGEYVPPSKRSKNVSSARHEHVVDEQEINLVVLPSDVQKQMETQRKSKRKIYATNASANSFDSFRFISLVHQERYSKFLAYKKIVLERNFQLEANEFSDIQAMIVSRGWVELTSFAKEASMELAKEFFANAYQDPAKQNGNNKNDLTKFTSFVRGKKVPFHDKIINQLFGLENHEQCSFEARMAKGSNINYQEILCTLCRPEVDWIKNKDGMPRRLHTSNLTPIARAWTTFVLHTLLSCSNGSDLTIQKATLLTAIVKGEPVNVGRLLANSLWDTANCSSPATHINHASLISKLCEKVGVCSKKNEEMVKPCRPITAKWIEKNSVVAYK